MSSFDSTIAPYAVLPPHQAFKLLELSLHLNIKDETVRSLFVTQFGDSLKGQFGWTGVLHADHNAYQASIDAGCFICSSVHDSFHTDIWHSTEDVYSEYHLRPSPFYPLSYVLAIASEAIGNGEEMSQLGEVNIEFELHPLRGRHSHQLVPRVEETLTLTTSTVVQRHLNKHIPMRNDGSESTAQIQKWLHRCIRSHRRCPQMPNRNSFHPTRLIDVGSANHSSCRLRLCLEEAPESPYIALSHCWGSGNIQKLTLANFESMKHGLLISTLSKTFQDVIRTTRSMEIRYLWIDALCIIQDSKDDWLREAALMGDVYAGAAFTIAATGAANGEGLFLWKDATMTGPWLIDIPTLAKTRLATYVIDHADFWKRNITRAPLYRRAWTLQERHLSSRMVHFSRNQMIWECNEIVACETYPDGIPKIRATYNEDGRRTMKLADVISNDPFHDNVDPEGEAELVGVHPYEYWPSVVEQYMRCSLSYSQDKLVAISGLAKKVANITREKYLAGLWDNDDLPIQLLWNVCLCEKFDGTISERTDSYRAPTWSWASLEGQIRCRLPNNSRKILINIVQASITPASDDLTGQVSGGCLHIKGSLFPIWRFRTRTENLELGDYCVDIDQADGDSTTELIAYPDIPIGPVTGIDLWFLPVCTGFTTIEIESSISGLLLEQSTVADDHFTRFGVAHLDSEGARRLCRLAEEDCWQIDEVLDQKEQQSIVLS
jgi:Heterokaryon incompatibility protein (HET)